MVVYFLDFIFYLIYVSITGPSTKAWYHKFWFSIGKKQSAENAYALFLTFLSVNLLLIVLNFMNLNFETIIFTSMGSGVLLLFIYLYFVVPKRYTYTRMKLIEHKFKKIKIWQARVILILLFLLLTMCFLQIVRVVAEDSG